MRLHFIDEIPLEFGTGTHICPKAGISQYDVFDTRDDVRREQIFVGAVGTSDNLLKLSIWLDKCSNPIAPPADSRHPNLYLGFCGFNTGYGFGARFVFEDEITRPLRNSDIKEILKIKGWNDRIDAAVEMYYEHVKFLA